MEHNINHKYFEGVKLYIPYSADPENRNIGFVSFVLPYCQE